jgi:lipid-A-disaccharide synthase
MKYYLIAGERSGDLHGANLIAAIRRHDPAAEFRAWGGDGMQAAGATLLKHYRELAYMGFWEVFKNLPTVLGFLRECQRDVLAYRPDVIVLIDYAGFNLRMARFGKRHGIRTFFYIAPKVWAWNQRRALKLKAYVDRLFVIFPFEVAFYRRFDYEVDYVGNPLLDAIAAFRPNPEFRQKHGLDARPVLALLPGSRRQEVEKMLPKMLQAAANFPEYQTVVSTVSNLPTDLYENLVGSQPLKLVPDAAYDLLTIAHAAAVTSGTATLETALFRVPQVVCYEGAPLSYEIAKRLIRVPYISLVNLIAERAVVPELIQYNFTVETLTEALKPLLENSPERQLQLDGFTEIRQRLGDPGASDRAGALMVKYLGSEK